MKEFGTALKKHLHLIVGIAAVILVVIVLFWTNLIWFFSCNPFAGQAQLRYRSKTVTATVEDSQRLRELLYGKPLHYDEPSCGFGEEVSISFNGDMFMPARDTCGIVKNHGKYIALNDEECEELHEILGHYDMKFPCL